LLLTGVLILALGAGAAAAFGLNQLKPVFFTRRSITRIAGLPVLGTVSNIISPDEIMARKRKTLVWAGTNVSLVLIAILIIALERPMSLALRTLLGGAGV
jgi:hypothetical protein